MLASEIFDEVRRRLDDTVEPYLWSTADLYRSLNNAINETCERTRCIQDSTGTACTVTVEEDTASYTLDPSIFVVRRARIAGQRDPLKLVNARALDQCFPGWDDDSLAQTGTPEYAVFDMNDGTIRLYPVPNADGELKLTVWRRPLESQVVEDLEDVPAIPERFHGELKHHILDECFSDTDSEKNNPERAALHRGLFERNVGQKPSAHHLRMMSTSRIRGTKAHFD